MPSKRVLVLNWSVLAQNILLAVQFTVPLICASVNCQSCKTGTIKIKLGKGSKYCGQLTKVDQGICHEHGWYISAWGAALVELRNNELGIPDLLQAQQSACSW